MAAITATRGVYRFNTDTTRVRDVADDMVKLMPDDRANALLFILTVSAKRKEGSTDTKKEWFEDDEVTFWGTISTASTTGQTDVSVADVTIFAAGDLVLVPIVNSASTAEEVMLVTAIAGSTAGTITVTRDWSGTSSADTLAAGAALRIIGSACTEDQDTPTQRYLAQTAKATYMQIFRTPVISTHTAMSTKKYATDGKVNDHAYQLTKAMIRHRSEIEAAGLWSKAYESLGTGSSARWSSMGLKSIISTNKTSASTTLTLTGFNTFCESIFKYGSSDEKLLVSAPKIISAINYWSQSKLITHVSDTLFGVKVLRWTSAFGDFILKNHYRLEDGVTSKYGMGDEAYAIDLPSSTLYYLDGGVRKIGDTKLFEDVQQDGTTTQVDEYRSQVGWGFRHEKRHGMLYNCSAYS